MAKKTETKVERETHRREVRGATKSKDLVGERVYVIPIREKIRHVPRYKKTPKAIKVIKEFVARHMKVYDRDLDKIKLDKFVNEEIWKRGIKNPIHKIKVKVFRDGENVIVELFELGKKFSSKKARLDKRDKKASEGVKAKKKEEAPEKEEDKNKDGVEDKKEEKEKIASSIEATEKLEKAAAKSMRQQTKVNTKEPKHMKRMALQK